VKRRNGAASARLALAAAVTLTVAITAPVARGDGDPASDYLLVQNVFVPFQVPSPAARTALELAVESVYAHGDRIKVALIYDPQDLGAVSSLFGKPSEYVHFLGIELGLWYGGPLLVAMPAGFGIYDGTLSTAADEQVLSTLPLSGTSPDALARSATVAVRQLAAAGALHSPDVTAPLVTAYPASAARGKPVALHFGVFDDSGYSNALVRIYEAGALVATVTSPERFKIGTRRVIVIWLVPKKLRSRQLHFCVIAIDRAGNRSTPACAPFLRVA
jgi:hypothetical protein